MELTGIFDVIEVAVMVFDAGSVLEVMTAPASLSPGTGCVADSNPPIANAMMSTMLSRRIMMS
jgi:hypothetical protein